MSRYRHEYKYMINEEQKIYLMMRAEGLMKRDSNVGEDGSYFIRSLYFDDLDNSCFYENENGTDPRSKFRIRYYNYDINHIKLEKKIKQSGMALKKTCTISMRQCQKFMSSVIPEPENETQKELFQEMRLRRMEPKVIVSYIRIPFIYSVGNVRITFDEDIAASNEISAFLEEEFVQRPILPLGKSVLEVKWDEILPLHIREYMQIDSLQWGNFSKYFLCRKYNINGGVS